ncbi:hypothetical protein BDF20DRAFT_76296 [Mycotypha africana]|uniref:uncharacterized protein n=1 Tax=Mycotypha africana TaxID=64632 RepID=UPI0023007F30|nr:uncharacterized protein BDF20DRAFT_76296 [Mycotypha africana]KAI8991918.1 hypothetical protein BDF20DRAFT_76296 [Mycotypha africana]
MQLSFRPTLSCIIIAPFLILIGLTLSFLTIITGTFSMSMIVFHIILLSIEVAYGLATVFVECFGLIPCFIIHGRVSQSSLYTSKLKSYCQQCYMYHGCPSEESILVNERYVKETFKRPLSTRSLSTLLSKTIHKTMTNQRCNIEVPMIPDKESRHNQAAH